MNKKLKDANSNLERMLDQRQKLISGLDMVESKIFQLQINVQGMSSVVSELMMPEFIEEKVFDSLVVEAEEIAQRKQPENKRVGNTDQDINSGIQQKNTTNISPEIIAGSAGKKGLNQ